MYFFSLRSKELGYKMKSALESPLNSSIKISVNGYADNMALIGKDHAEAKQILIMMLERFLSYYGMELNAAKCGYQYLSPDPRDTTA
jgi:hypothetical protein